MHKKKFVTGFTLIELLVAVSIFAVVAVVLYSTFRSGVVAYKRIGEEIEESQKIRYALNAITKDIKNIIYISNIPFEGGSDSLSFVSTTSLSKDADNNISKISFFLKKEGDQTLLVRSEQSLLDVVKEIATLEDLEEIPDEDDLELDSKPLLEGVATLNFTYLLLREDEEDAEDYEWVDFWEEETMIPMAINIEIKLDKGKATLSRKVLIPAYQQAESVDILDEGDDVNLPPEE